MNDKVYARLKSHCELIRFTANQLEMIIQLAQDLDPAVALGEPVEEYLSTAISDKFVEMVIHIDNIEKGAVSARGMILKIAKLCSIDLEMAGASSRQEPPCTK